MTGYCKRSPLAAPGGFRLLWAGAVLALVACGADPSPLQLAEGQEAYLRHCASCHGNQGEGRPPSFPPLAGSEWMDLPSEALALIVLYGLRGEIEVAGRTYRGYMPPMQHIGDAEIAALLGYAERAWAGREPGLNEADIARLRTARGDHRTPMDGKEGLLQALAELP